MTRREEPVGAELTTDEAKRCVIDEVRKVCPNGLVAFSGGEFLLRSDALELLAYNRQVGLDSFINTNGRSLTPERLRDVRKAAGKRLIFGFSLDSIDGETQGKTRTDSPDEVLELARMCDRARVGYFFLVTITRLNMPTLSRTVQFLRDHHIPMLRSPFVLRGAGKDLADLAFDRDDMQKVIHPVLRDNPLCYISHTPFFASPEFMERTWKHLQIPIPTLGCQAGRGFVGISAEGNVAPCVHLLDSTVDCGNVKATPLSELLATHPVLTGLRDGSQVKGKCARCRYKHSCRGCRAVAYYATGDHLAADPTCFFEPEDESTRSEFEAVQTSNVKRFIGFVALHSPWNRIFRPASFWARVKALVWVLTHPT
jgi:radical SAM protein with 4Fe4S-binding SPASM domain